MPDEKSDDQLVKVEVSVSAATVDAVDELARLQGITPAEALVRAIGRDRFLVRTAKGGGKVLVQEAGSTQFERVVIDR